MMSGVTIAMTDKDHLRFSDLTVPYVSLEQNYESFQK